VFWVWKGDYINMGAGAEIGFYKHEGLGDIGDGRWDAVDSADTPDMSLVLSNADEEILSYDPDESMPWVAAWNTEPRTRPWVR
jgi:hypothetical protein